MLDAMLVKWGLGGCDNIADITYGRSVNHPLVAFLHDSNIMISNLAYNKSRQYHLNQNQTDTGKDWTDP